MDGPPPTGTPDVTTTTLPPQVTPDPRSPENWSRRGGCPDVLRSLVVPFSVSLFLVGQGDGVLTGVDSVDLFRRVSPRGPDSRLPQPLLPRERGTRWVVLRILSSDSPRTGLLTRRSERRRFKKGRGVEEDEVPSRGEWGRCDRKIYDLIY